MQIYPHPNRPDDFRLDGKLQAEVNSRCMALDLSKLPGFSADEHGRAKVTVKWNTPLEGGPAVTRNSG